MISIPRWLLIALPLMALLWAVWEFQPSRQLEKQFARMVSAAERRDWNSVETFFSPDYRDAWGMNREEALQAAREVFGQFLTLSIATEPRTLERTGPTATISCHPKLSGRGAAFAQLIIDRANALKDPTTFRWTRISWKPWDWKLISISQPEISEAAAGL